MNKINILRNFCSKEKIIDFGHQNINIKQKQPKVNTVFDSVASKQDIMNDVMSVGMHRYWKNVFVDEMKLLTGSKILDVASGSGDIAFRIHQKMADTLDAEFRRVTSIHNRNVLHLSDINTNMLNEARNKQKNSIKAHDLIDVEIKESNAETLEEFEDDQYDYITISFGIRNVPDREKALRSFHKKLKKGGRVMIMEFSQVSNPLFGQIQSIQNKVLLPIMGKVIANDSESYRYLAESIERFPSKDDFAQLIEKSGFNDVKYLSLTDGVVCIHSGIKL